MSSRGSRRDAEQRSAAPVCVLALVLLVACDTGGGGASPPATADAGASPNASILPAPLAEAPEIVDASADGSHGGISVDALGRLLAADAGVTPPEPMPPDQPLAIEPPASKELSGLVAEGVWRWRDVPGPPKAPE